MPELLSFTAGGLAMGCLFFAAVVRRRLQTRWRERHRLKDHFEPDWHNKL